MAKKITIALAGNPNSGKTTIFNALTGSKQHVGNYPGVTVEKVEGRVKYGEYNINVIDLPGTYSLTANSIDELVARHFIIEEKPDVIVNIIDSSNLERNLYLSTQIIELGVPMVMVFNMHDIALGNGVEIDKNLLSELLGRPIIFVIGTKKIGVDKILEESISLIEDKSRIRDVGIRYGKDLEGEIAKLENIVIKDEELVRKYSTRWIAVKSLENDKEVIKKLRKSPFADEFFEQLKTSVYHLKVIFSDEAEAVIADRRYGFISGACSEATKITKEDRHTLSDKIDRVMINRVLGFPIFLGLMWLVFQFSFKVSQPFMGWIETGIELLGSLVGRFFPEGSPIQSLAVDGVIAGVGGVLVFVPIIFLMFFAIAILEYSGYMARAAFIMDRLMHKIGLHGRSFIPMLLGFGCNVPAIMATRTIEDRRDRLVTILVSPFMSCGARLPVYALFIGAFFPQKIAGNVLFSLYLLGIITAVISAKVFRKYIFKGEAAPFVMELPPYRIPTLKAVVINMCQRGMIYLKKAGTIILAGCLVIWFLSNFPWSPSYSKDFDALIEKAGNDQELVTK
ncbi:MAG: ferrous iron transport protein B, partial [bacterium]|nr:ferrous iron transport protein B [bacterium]